MDDLQFMLAVLSNPNLLFLPNCLTTQSVLSIAHPKNGNLKNKLQICLQTTSKGWLDLNSGKKKRITACINSCKVVDHCCRFYCNENLKGYFQGFHLLIAFVRLCISGQLTTF